MLWSHYEGILIEEQAHNGTSSGDWQSKDAEREEQRQWDDVSQRDAAPPIIIAEFSVGHFAVGEQGNFRCEGIDFACQCQKEIDRNTDWKKPNK